jgi:hypothetical protein
MTTDLVPRREPIVGYPEEVAMVLRMRHQMGRLLTRPEDISIRPLPNGKVVTTVTLLVPATRRPARPVLAPRKQDSTAAALGKGLLFGAGLLLVSAALVVGAIWAVVASVGLPAIVGTVTVIAIAGLLLSGTGKSACAGIVQHCGGCRKH